MSDSWMGSVAAQDQYRPLGNDPWTNTMMPTWEPPPGSAFPNARQKNAALDYAIAPDRGMAFGTMTPQEATIALPERAEAAINILTPQSPLDFLPAGKGLRLGLGMGSLAALTPSEAEAGIGSIGKKGIKAFHSSPHDFDKFDLAKIGTGEGAQVYGHGLYFAENPAVSGRGGQYWQQFLQRFPEQEQELAKQLQSRNFNHEAAAEIVQRHIDDVQRRIAPGGIFDKPSMADARRRAQEQVAELTAHRDLIASGKPVGPRTYEVNIKADPAHMLDWDKGLHGQSPEVRSALERFGFKSDKGLMKASDDALYEALTGDPNIKIPKALPDPSGAQIYESSKLVPGGYRDKVRATAALQEAGIPGIKYLDEGSRGMNTQILSPHDTVHGQWLVKNLPNGDVFYRGADEAAARAAYEAAPKPTSNYVVFDPSIIDIMKKYGIAGAVPAGIGALAAQDQYNAQ